MPERPCEGRSCFEKLRFGHQNIPRRDIFVFEKLLFVSQSASRGLLSLKKHGLGLRASPAGALFYKIRLWFHNIARRGVLRFFCCENATVLVADVPRRDVFCCRKLVLGLRTSLGGTCFLKKTAVWVSERLSRGAFVFEKLLFWFQNVTHRDVFSELLWFEPQNILRRDVFF